MSAPPKNWFRTMATLVNCRQGHRWEVGASGSDPPPQLVCPVCGERPEGLVDQGASRVR